ncbi:acyl-CoA desaturase [Chitinophagaceae bacterium MMS25-I14]
MPVIIFFIASWYLSLFAQTFFQHRYAAHGAFKMSRSWERVFYIYAYIVQGPSYLSARAYAILHRMHHAYTDTDKDPHSPQHFKNVFAMMWATKKVYSSIFYKPQDIEPRFLKNVPDWPLLDKWAHSWGSRIIWLLLYTAFYIKFATSPWLWLLFPVQVLMSPVHGAIINWYAHKYGYTNHEMKNTAQNLLHVDFLMLGESYHNNHHRRASSPNFGMKWHEIDPVYPVIRLFHKLRIIQINPVNLKATEHDF